MVRAARQAMIALLPKYRYRRVLQSLLSSTQMSDSESACVLNLSTKCEHSESGDGYDADQTHAALTFQIHDDKGNICIVRRDK